MAPPPVQSTQHTMVKCKLSSKHSILSAELYAIKMSLLIVKLNLDQYNGNTVIFTDSKTAVMLIQSENNNFTHDISEIKS